ncbi:Trypsin-like peptidase domain-containing protein [Streptomyces sp. DI166]|uniref:effector-associated domain 2-containing protein n=1 Tax=Streptomyces sp. DI166 TaxID=1839783 RepID=UPI0007F32C40|nr:trypsin-like peptidase domain-containing protein [Streptomyces sp. DI166]SBT91965.1 Trypsin-like peptidase domain-containing protein [Streptomyces sp. DI166]
MRELGESVEELHGGPDPARVTEVWAPSDSGERRGSGYRVGERYVLTAAHPVRGALHAGVLDGGTRRAARVLFCSEAAGAALLELLEPSGEAPLPVYGTVPETDAGVPFTTAGFPLAAPGAVVRAGRLRPRRTALELTVSPPAATHSPWEGMSGAAVWCEGALVGLVGGQERVSDPSRLTAARADRWHDLLTGPQLALLHEHAGFPATPAGLTRPAPSPPTATGPTGLARLPANLPPRELDGLVTALTAIPSVSDRNSLTLILEGVDPVVAAMSPRSPALRPDIFGIVRTCLRYPGTLDQLLDAIRLVEGESVGVARMDQEAVELSRRHC